MEPSEIDHLNGLSDQLEAIYRKCNPARYTSPGNRLEEKGTFLSAWRRGSVYNPQFEYALPSIGWTSALESFLSTFKPQNQWAHTLYQDASHRLARLHSLWERNPAEITNISIDRYGPVKDALVQDAYQLLNQTVETRVSDATITATEAAVFLRQALAEADLHEWQVVVSVRMSARMSVRSISQKVNIQADAMFNQQQLNRLLVHEIGTHVFRYMNGTVNPLRMLRMGLVDYLTTEEGLATYHEQQYGLSDPETQRRYALRVIAAHLSLNHSFYEVFAHLCSYTDEESAFAIVTRAKRGMMDTSQSGAHVKDKVYFEGLQAVSAHLSEYPNDYALLMCGKVSLRMLPDLRELKEVGVIFTPCYLPEQLFS
ncbi:MAG: tyrosine/phenylalanine carboxypeptidase domain-containing protein [Chloroflexota bacterium]